KSTTSLSVANSGYDTCVLEHMQGETSDQAAFAVKEACIHASERQLPDEALQTLMTSRATFSEAPVGWGDSGLYITINNNSGYTLTELVVEIVNKKTEDSERYVVRSFPNVHPGEIVSGLPSDRTVWEMIKPGLAHFFLPIRQTTENPSTWWS